MDEDRTFGIEIECLSSIPRSQLAEVINTAIAAQGHTCVTAGYYHNTDGLNTTRWEVKPDGSINTEIGFTYDAEVVSPVLKGQFGLDVLQLVVDAITPYVKVNKSCGLHVHHGIKSEDNVGNIIIGWLRSEKTIYECLPPSRNSHFSLPLYRRATTVSPYSRRRRGYSAPRRPRTFTIPNEITDVQNWWYTNMGGNERYVGLNVASYWLRGTIEVRAAAGTVEYPKMENWIKVTQKLIIQASRNPHLFTEGIDNVVNVLGGNAWMETAPTTGWLPKRTTGSGYAFWRLLESNGVLDREMLVAECANVFGKSINCAQIYVNDALSILAKKAGMVAVKGKEISITFPQVTRVNEECQETEDLVWLRQRHAKFSRMVVNA